ncbi:MAG: hypothetical protein ACREPL_11135 [Rhodanobacteraceae bacterium]
MIELAVLALVAVGAFWLFGALIVGVFKLTFGLIAAVFSGVFVLLGVGLAALILVPIVLFALSPLWLPVACVAALVWVIARAARPAAPARRRPVSG